MHQLLSTTSAPAVASALALALAAVTPAAAQDAAQDDDINARVAAVIAQSPVIDGHNDLPYAIQGQYGGDPSKVDLNKDASKLAAPLHTDIARLRAGGVGAQFWSVYVPAELEGAQSAEAVHVQIDIVRQLVAQYSYVFELADSADDIERIESEGRIASMLGMEGGEAINNNLAILRGFRAEGVLYMTLCHSKTTDWVDSATDAPVHGGLSAFGEDVVREMNRIGMLVDLSHTSAEAMKDALKVSKAPVIFSHSSARALSGHPRNVPDEVLKMMPKNGGVVMVNFYPLFVSEEIRQWGAQKAAEEGRLKSLNPNDPEAVSAGVDAWASANPRPDATLAQVADHIDHIAKIAGVDHVGIGSDFDGIDYTPIGLEGVDTYPALLAELARRGWSDEDLAKLSGGNLMRALRGAEAVARG